MHNTQQCLDQLSQTKLSSLVDDFTFDSLLKQLFFLLFSQHLSQMNKRKPFKGVVSTLSPARIRCRSAIRALEAVTDFCVLV